MKKCNFEINSKIKSINDKFGWIKNIIDEDST